MVARQVRFNRASSNRWDAVEPHRRCVTGLILSACRPGAQRLCVLGAGNCNDLDLQELSQAYEETRLVDLDAHALEEACQRQSVAASAQVVPHRGTDLSGIAARLTALCRPGVTQGETDELLRLAANPPELELGGPFDVVASTCLLTQLMNSAVDAMGDDHPKLPELLATIRRTHIRLLARTVKAGGTGLLITDVASSDACSRITTAPDSELAGLESSLAANGQYFLGVEPALIEEQLKTDVYLVSRIRKTIRTPPWRWRITSRRTYLIVAFLFTARG